MLKTWSRIAGIFFLLVALYLVIPDNKTVNRLSEETEEEQKDRETRALYTHERWKYEADMIQDPTTGQPLFGLRYREIEFAKSIPVRTGYSPFARTSAQNTYLPAGPNNQGGRTRALAYDVRYNGSSNRVILSGGISGGIFRSADGGSTWALVTPQGDVHNVSSIAQDPRSGFENTWYAGGGEYVGNSVENQGLGASYLGYGLLKSTDNGVTWTRLPLNNITEFNGSAIAAGQAERFDHPFDYVHKIVVNPLNGDVYVACHRRIVRSTNGGSSFQTVFGSSTNAANSNGQCDIAISATGKVYVAFNGSAPDLSLRGIWRSLNGNQNSYTRLAGGSTLGVDSVANWRANSYSFFVSGGINVYDTRRILLGLAPSNENILYVVYENGLINSSFGRNKEADLFKLDMTSGNNWTNLSNNVPDFPGGDIDGVDPFSIQYGYDLFITVKPNNPNFVLLGGVSLYRSTDGFATIGNTSWIGGYGNTLPTTTFYINSHPDIHNLVFNPSNSNEAICANDGGLQMTNNITATNPGNTPVTWINLNNYQTLQYYSVAIDPDIGLNNFAGGSQDNGTQFRDKTGLLNTQAADSNNHNRVISGDGCTSGISKRIGANKYLFGSTQYGSLRRGVLQLGFSSTDITPTGLTPSYTGATVETGEFVTNFLLNPDNSEDLYYVNFNRLFRTTNSFTVTQTSGWVELTGVSSAVNSSNGTTISIRALAVSRGDYTTDHVLYIGTTNGRIFRLKNPRNASAATLPEEITPPSAVADMTSLNIQSISVNPNNDNEILVAVTNYGRTNSLGVFQNVPNILWCGNAKDAVPIWKVAEGNLAGTTTTGFISARSCMITVKKDASNNPVTEYYVGTAAGLFATENLGTTLLNNQIPNWQREGAASLNYSVISSIAYRPSDNVLLVGTHGNGLYYTYLGTSNLVTGINNPIVNDKNFIKFVYPTISSSLINYTTGNKTDVKKITVQLFDMTGKIAYWQESAYQNGAIDIARFSPGAYILSIYSDNQKYRHVQKIIR